MNYALPPEKKWNTIKLPHKIKIFFATIEAELRANERISSSQMNTQTFFSFFSPQKGNEFLYEHVQKRKVIYAFHIILLKFLRSSEKPFAIFSQEVEG